eukprot:364615-Chlamydomonas_euryale.AAC.4
MALTGWFLLFWPVVHGVELGAPQLRLDMVEHVQDLARIVCAVGTTPHTSINFERTCGLSLWATSLLLDHRAAAGHRRVAAPVPH